MLSRDSNRLADHRADLCLLKTELQKTVFYCCYVCDVVVNISAVVLGLYTGLDAA